MNEDFLGSDIKFLTGVGPKKAELLNKELNIFKFEDLLYYFPFKYTDRSKIYKISEINEEMPYVQLKGKFFSFILSGEKNSQRLNAEFFDETGSIEIVWFQGIKFVKDKIKKDKEYIIFGKPTVYRDKFNIAHPEIEEAESQNTKINAALQADYNTTEKLKKGFILSKNILSFQDTLFKVINGRITETLPDYLLQKFKFLSLSQSLFNIHFPQDVDKLKAARYRIKFEELFYSQLKILKIKNNRNQNTVGFIFKKIGDNFNNFYNNNLKFELTNAQKKVLKEIRADFLKGKQSNRLLQGDVGSGKTIVALLSMLIAIDNGFQACLMAPTEILAQQHFISITEFLKELNINIAILTGSTKTKARRLIHEQLLNAEIQILIGTHALIEDVVQFKNLGLAIIDEQHRFGVAQRAKIWTKNEIPPHVIVMTATPIPRTLAMTVYGDLEVSVINELPPGRKPIKTIHATDAKRLRIFQFLKEQIALGRQIYIVYPLIKESETLDYKDLEDGYESISRAFPSPQYAVSIVHGQMKNEEKEKAMQLFVKGITHIMVATTVIEVGVNVPNASVMIIESAERFGLSQLHQLRGRVGRGADQSYCVLMTSYKLSKEAKQRIFTMVNSNDGFEIAEADLKLRGPGDIDGIAQSGLGFNFRIANIVKDQQILQLARNTANDILDDDPELQKPENQILIKQMRKLRRSENIEWTKIS